MSITQAPKPQPITHHYPFDFRRNPPYPPKPDKPIRHKSMTIAAGILTDSGIVLGSDTKYTTDGIVNYGEKIFPLPMRDTYRVVVAGAGDVGFIRSAAQKIDDALPPRPGSLTALRTIIEHANKEFYEQYVLPHGIGGPGYELLVAISHRGDGVSLLKTTANATVPVTSYEPLGSGGVTAEPYSKMYWKEMPNFEAELMAIFLVKYAKTYDNQSGGDTRVFTLSGDNLLLRLRPQYIEMAEDYFVNFNKLALSMLLPMEIGASLDKELFQNSIKSMVEKVGDFRSELNKFHQNAYQVVA